jgi:phage baseplate assembly protein W
MSADYQLAWRCPHLTMEEVVPLDPDRRSLFTSQPIAGSGTVRILVNDELYVPQGGLFVGADLYGTVSGPFDITENEADLTITSPVGSQTFVFPISGTVRWTTDQVVNYLLRNDLTIVSVLNSNGHLLFKDASTIGPDSFVEVSGKAAFSLGFGAVTCGDTSGYQRRAQGRQIYPAWELDSREDVITNRYPRFRQAVVTNPVFKVTYTVPVQRCRRCRATFVENDYRFNTGGQAILIENENLLYQAAFKIILTDQGSNPYHPWYGTTLRSRIGSKAIAAVSALISEDVRRALAKIQVLQEEQSKYQTVTFKERLYSVLSVNVLPHEQDPTTFMVDVVAQNASAEPVNLSIVFAVPDVVALMGTNGLMLGTEAAGLSAEQARTIFIPGGARALID